MIAVVCSGLTVEPAPGSAPLWCVNVAVRVMRGANDTLYVLIMDDPFYVIPPEGKGSVSFSLLPTNSSAGGKGRK